MFPILIEFVIVDEIEPAPSGKHFYVISKVDRDPAPAGTVSAVAEE